MSGLAKAGTIFNDFMARRIIDKLRINRVGNGIVPFGLNALDRTNHTNAIDAAIGGKPANQNRHVKFAAFAINDIGE